MILYILRIRQIKNCFKFSEVDDSLPDWYSLKSKPVFKNGKNHSSVMIVRR